jgi:hypothetical protein
MLLLLVAFHIKMLVQVQKASSGAEKRLREKKWRGASLDTRVLEPLENPFGLKLLTI